MNNEKNNSLFIQLLGNKKYIFIILKTFAFTFKNILGLLISTLAAIIITINFI
jgi:hypothetical protein